APILVAELQGGWFNQYQHKCTYDDIYNYYGEDYQRLLFDCMLSQGVTMMSYYMFYGGTNWGSLGDPDVYTSYDYSACVREWVFLSGRGRKLRLGVLFARSFGRALAATDLIEQSLTVRPAQAYNRSRRTAGGGGAPSATFHFLRNFAGPDAARAIEVEAMVAPGVPPVTMRARLAYRAAAVAVGDYAVGGTGLTVVLSTLAVHCRMAVSGGEVWVVQSDEDAGGELLVHGGAAEVAVAAGTLGATGQVVADGAATLVQLGGSRGWCEVAGHGGRLVVVAVTGPDVYTLTASFEAMRGATATGAAEEPASVSWGAVEIQHDAVSGEVRVEARDGDTGVYMLLGAGVTRPSGFEEPSADDVYRGVEGLVWRAVSGPGPLSQQALTFNGWHGRTSNLDGMPWVPLPLKHGSLSEPGLDTLDLGYTSGHVLYRISFPTPTSGAKSLHVDLDIRNRCRVYLNGVLLGGHTTYSHLMFRPGVKNGPDPFAERVRYALPAQLLVESKHEWNRLVVVCESWGFPRMAFWLNDCRNPRGLLSARLSNTTTARAARWEVAGVDVTRLPLAYASTGFPDEHAWGGDVEEKIELEAEALPVSLRGGPGAGAVLRAGPGGTPRWYRTRVTVRAGDGVRMPLRAYLSGPGDAHVLAGGLYVGRFYGNSDAPQASFPIPESLVEAGEFELALLVYPTSTAAATSAACDVGSGDWVSVHMVPWHVDASTWSGNAKDKGQDAVFSRENMSVFNPELIPEHNHLVVRLLPHTSVFRNLPRHPFLIDKMTAHQQRRRDTFSSALLAACAVLVPSIALLLPPRGVVELRRVSRGVRAAVEGASVLRSSVFAARHIRAWLAASFDVPGAQPTVVVAGEDALQAWRDVEPWLLENMDRCSDRRARLVQERLESQPWPLLPPNYWGALASILLLDARLLSLFLELRTIAR
ncbi:hypothetical protein HK405_005872, partial [Cladochytrium tenue]